ncbi:MAG: ATP-binding cassette domain-containing protein [Bacteriovoracaceae bacterium]|nr:ATP-binding cassette domain-containing protein [Bacteriovoracaceae bacterium]
MNQVPESPFLISLYPLLDALGWKNEGQVLDDAMPYCKKEFNLNSLLATMANLQYRVTKFSGSIHDIEHQSLPALYIDSNGDPLAITKKNDSAIISFDGTSRSYKLVEAPTLTGDFYMFIFESSDNISLVNAIPNWFVKLLFRFKRMLVTCIVLSFVMAAVSLATPLFVMTIYGQLTIANAGSSFPLLILGVLIFILSFIALKSLRNYVLTFISTRMGAIVNKEVVRRLLYLPPTYTEKAGISSQLSRIRDFESIQNFFSGIGVSSLLDAPFVIVLLFATYLIGGIVVIVPIITIILFIIMALTFIPLSKKSSSGLAKSSKRKNDFLIESIGQISEIRSANLSSAWRERFNKFLGDAILNQGKSGHVSELINTVSSTITSLAALATIGVGVSQVIADQMTAGGLMAVILILWKILAPLKSFFSVMSQFDRIKNSISQLDRFMSLPIEKRNEESFQVTRPLKGEVKFDQVSLRYTAESYPALLGVSFDISHGECLVVIGHNGSGKSSVLKLLLGLITPQVGRVQIDKMNVQQQNLVKHRRQISYCPQESHFFNDSIINNIELYAPKHHSEELITLLKEVDLFDEIMSLPRKLDSALNENDESFNLYFLKRLSLVRSFLKKSNLLLIDDLTKDLNVESVSTALSLVKKYKNTRTIIITTHDARVLKVADKAIWLDHGKVRMYGTGKDVRDAFTKEQR